MKSINLLMLLLIWSSFPAKSNAQPDSDSDFQVIDTSRQTYSSYLTLPNLGSNRWPSGTIEWWYNPTGQLLPTALALAAIEKATNTWEGVAGVNFIYMGKPVRRRIFRPQTGWSSAGWTAIRLKVALAGIVLTPTFGGTESKFTMGKSVSTPAIQACKTLMTFKA